MIVSTHFFTIGHSTHTLDQFLALLKEHQIELLADIRRFPGSRKHPHFHRDSLARLLPAAGIDYRWMESLGGRRGKSKTDSTANLGLRNESFRNYADYMATEDFRHAIGELLKEGQAKRTAYMCAEGLYWQCHRRLVSDYLVAQGHIVDHIMPSGEIRPHTLTSGAEIVHGELCYPAASAEKSQANFDFKSDF